MEEQNMFNENLRILRKQKGMSQEALAQQLNVVRQTVSKWEKGLSVPDAEMLTRISELFEVPVSQMLGSTIEDETDTNQIAVQLAMLNEYMVSRSKRNKMILKIVLIVAAALFVFYILLAVTARIAFSGRTSMRTKETLVCTLDGEEYMYEILYDEQHRVIEAGGDAFIANHVDTERYDDANVLIAQIENYFWDHGGTCERE